MTRCLLRKSGVRRLLWLTLLTFLGACANLQPAQNADFAFLDAHLFGATAIAFSPDNKILASGGYQGEIKLWQLNPPHLIKTLTVHADSVRALAFSSPDLLLSGADAKRDDLPADMVEKFVADRDPNVRYFITRNPLVTPVQQLELLQDKDELVRQAAKKGPRAVAFRQRPGQAKLVK